MVVVATAALLVWACGGIDRRRAIAVTVPPQKFMLERIAGPQWDVRCLLGSGAGVSDYDPSQTHMLGLDDAEAYFCIGRIPVERAILDKVSNFNPDIIIYDNSEGIDSLATADGEPDPRTWISVKNAKRIAFNMYDALCELDPGGRRGYTRRLNDFLTELNGLDSRIDSMLAGASSRVYFTWSPTTAYFARDYGLMPVALEPSASAGDNAIRSIERSVSAARRAGAHVMLVDRQPASGAMMQGVVQSMDTTISTVTVNPMSYDWEGEMLRTAAALSSI